MLNSNRVSSRESCWFLQHSKAKQHTHNDHQPQYGTVRYSTVQHTQYIHSVAAISDSRHRRLTTLAVLPGSTFQVQQSAASTATESGAYSMWSDQPNHVIQHDADNNTHSMQDSVSSPSVTSHPSQQSQTAYNNLTSTARLSPPPGTSDTHPAIHSPSHSGRPASPSLHLHLSASMPSIAQAKTSPVLRGQVRQRVGDEDEDEELREENERKKNENGLFTLPPPLASGGGLFASPAGPRAAPVGFPALHRAPSTKVLKPDEPLHYNRVRIEYAAHVASDEMTDTANLIRQALQLRRHFVYHTGHQAHQHEHVDIQVNPPFRLPSTDIPPATQHAYLMVDGVYVAWEGTEDNPPDLQKSFSTDLSSPTKSTQAALASSPPTEKPSPSLFNNFVSPSSPTSPTSSSSAPRVVFSCPSRSDYALALSLIMDIAGSGPLRSFAHNRLYLLESRFNLHQTLNGDLEALAQRAVPHRDFYNVRKIDNHVHHSAAMNQKHLLRFIKYKLKQNIDEIVIVRDGKPLSLRQVFESLKLTPYDLSVDTLDMHADTKTFHRFDRFNLKYNPIGESRLREIFLKYNNLTKGKYLAELTQQVFDDLEQNKYQMAEYRLSIYGSSASEWDTLSDWVCDNSLFHYNVRWMIQVPRLYAVYKAAGKVQHFGQMLDNIFRPLFEVSVNPSSHPALHRFLQQCVGFDIVDDESVRERSFSDHLPLPDHWDGKNDPPYPYFAYYVYANLYTLNQLRRAKGFTTFAFRPHSGEAGDPEHLACTFLVARSINHGIVLWNNPSLQYLYYLAQVGISMSPLSNNLLFLTYDKNPFPRFFQRGMNVTLSTDDPLILHVSKEPLVEEYTVAAQVWKLTSVDMSEIARNSVLQSGWGGGVQAALPGWPVLGARYDG